MEIQTSMRDILNMTWNLRGDKSVSASSEGYSDPSQRLLRLNDFCSIIRCSHYSRVTLAVYEDYVNKLGMLTSLAIMLEALSFDRTVDLKDCIGVAVFPS